MAVATRKTRKQQTFTQPPSISASEGLQLIPHIQIAEPLPIPEWEVSRYAAPPDTPTLTERFDLEDIGRRLEEKEGRWGQVCRDMNITYGTMRKILREVEWLGDIVRLHLQLIQDKAQGNIAVILDSPTNDNHYDATKLTLTTLGKENGWVTRTEKKTVDDRKDLERRVREQIARVYGIAQEVESES